MKMLVIAGAIALASVAVSAEPRHFERHYREEPHIGGQHPWRGPMPYGMPYRWHGQLYSWGTGPCLTEDYVGNFYWTCGGEPY